MTGLESNPDRSLSQRNASLRLAMIPGVGPRIRQALLEYFGDPATVLAAPLSELKVVKGVGTKLGKVIEQAREEIDLEPLEIFCHERGIRIITEQEQEYPRALLEIVDPPGVLFLRGSLRPTDALAIAIVGTRHATAYGKQQAERLAGGLARAGMTVVSGLARGIDAAAHRGALQAGGRTLAVLGSGVSNIYPPEHVELAGQVVAGGALLSESPPESPPLPGAFPQRNRIITGMSLGVIVVEAAQRSGALISARHAMEQGREVFAVPGRVDSRVSGGCHRLIRDGAKLVESVDDVLEELGPMVEAAPQPDGSQVRRPAELQLNEVERKVLDQIDTAPTDIDTIMTAADLPVPRVLATLSVLEMKRLIRRVSGNQVIRV
jgi:DNA processing protein